MPNDLRTAKAQFPSTCWSRVVAAANADVPDARASPWPSCLAADWFPVYALIRRKGHDPETALDLTQDYFTRLLEKLVLAMPTGARGGFARFC